MIGPHAKKEVTYLLAGHKPAAILAPYEITLADWKALQDAGLFHIPCYTLRGKQEHIFTQKGEEWRARQIAKVFQRVIHKGNMSDTEHARLGILLGYKKQDIWDFLKHMHRMRKAVA